MFEQLVNEAASRLSLPVASVSALLRGLLSLITNERTGGAGGFVDLFRRAGLGDVLTSWFGGKEGKPITTTHLESALGTSTLDKLANASGVTRASATSALAFLLPKVMGLLTPNGVLPSSSALLSQLSGYVDRPVGRAVPVPHQPVERRDWPSWLPWAAAALIALVAWLWWRGPSGTIDPQLTLSNRDGQVTYSGLVRDEATRTTVVRALNTTFGEANVSGDLRIDRNVKPAPWLPRLNDLFTSVKDPGVELSLNGDAINLGGWLSAADRQAISDKVRGIFGATATIGTLTDPATEAVRAANDKAVTALKALGTSGVAPDAVVQAMNLAIINFPSGSAQISVDSMDVLQNSAAAIKAMPRGSRIEISGHTDNTGDSASNLRLSQARADAVKSALVEAGVSAAALTATGYGDSRPRATNDTEFGRFQNRRIEYSVARS
jgi:OOP family OmpA-OmpF porin